MEDIEEPKPDQAAMDMRSKIVAIMRDTTMTEAEKAKARQAVMCGGKWAPPAAEEPPKGKASSAAADKKAAAKEEADNSLLLDDNLKCAMCLSLCERPVTAPCQHNFCLACFTKWHNQGKKTCPTCRAPFSKKFTENPRINTALITAIRMAKNPISASAAPAKEYKRIDNEARPDEAFVTERAVKTGRANACSGRIFVTCAPDHFGPIGPEHDPLNKTGVKVGSFWKDRMDCRQWGTHLPHVAGIAGQGEVGAQSVVLSGGYTDDRDEGEWFLYTGSGGRDLSGNKRTNKEQSADQEFTSGNKALQVSCERGLPVRVVRSHKEKRSAYAPTEDAPVRYDGVYRILRCWRGMGTQEHLVCRYLFVRADNEPAPWVTSDDGDDVRLEIPAIAAEEIKKASGGDKKVTKMGANPFWDYNAETNLWGWAKPQPASQKTPGASRAPTDPSKKLRQHLNQQEKALKDFHCGLCKSVMTEPISTPCGHRYCRGCLEKKFAGVTEVMETSGVRSLRVRKNAKPCPACKTDICEFMSNAQVNREMSAIISKLQAAVAKAKDDAAKAAAAAADGGAAAEVEEGDDDFQEEEDAADAEEVAEAAADAAGPSSISGSSAADAATTAGGSTSGEAAADAAGPNGSGAASGSADAAAQATVTAAAKPVKAYIYAKELTGLVAEFPEFDVELIRSMLEDQAGDVLEVRLYLRKMAKHITAAAKSPRGKAPKASAAVKEPKAAKAGGKKRGRPAKAAAEGEVAGSEAEHSVDTDMPTAAVVPADEVEAEQCEQGLEAAAGEVKSNGQLLEDKAVPMAVEGDVAEGSSLAIEAVVEVSGGEEAPTAKKARKGTAAGAGGAVTKEKKAPAARGRKAVAAMVVEGTAPEAESAALAVAV